MLETVDKIAKAFDGEESILIVVSEKMKNKIEKELKECCEYPPISINCNKTYNTNSFQRGGLVVHYTTKIEKLH